MDDIEIRAVALQAAATVMSGSKETVGRLIPESKTQAYPDPTFRGRFEEGVFNLADRFVEYLKPDSAPTPE